MFGRIFGFDGGESYRELRLGRKAKSDDVAEVPIAVMPFATGGCHLMPPML